MAAATATARATATSNSWVDAPAPLSPGNVEEPKKAPVDAEDKEASQKHGVSILKEIFPDHGAAARNAAGKVAAPPLQQLLSSCPSPARALVGNSNGYYNAASNQVPYGPPAHTPSISMPLATPVVPPPPMMPAPSQEQFSIAPAVSEMACGSYRERLRAGGRGAFQRAFEAGYVPKNMKQEWGSYQTPAAAPQDAQSGYGMGDGSQMWSGMGQMQSNDYYGVPMQGQMTCVQQAPQTPDMQHLSSMPMQPSQMQPVMLPQMAMQQPMQMMPMAQGEQSPAMSPLSQQMHMQMQMQMPGLMSQENTPSASGTCTPAESARSECMAILGVQSAQFPSNQDELAAQLNAFADAQRYED